MGRYHSAQWWNLLVRARLEGSLWQLSHITPVLSLGRGLLGSHTAGLRHVRKIGADLIVVAALFLPILISGFWPLALEYWGWANPKGPRPGKALAALGGEAPRSCGGGPLLSRCCTGWPLGLFGFQTPRHGSAFGKNLMADRPLARAGG